jgi:hypothetical protein
MDSFQWRLGLAYYSFFREMHMMSLLRHHHQLDVGYHFILDSEWAADFACAGVFVELYVENSQYKSEGGGRKGKCGRLNPSATVVSHLVRDVAERGKPQLVNEADVAKAAAAILHAGGRQIEDAAFTDGD